MWYNLTSNWDKTSGGNWNNQQGDIPREIKYLKEWWEEKVLQIPLKKILLLKDSNTSLTNQSKFSGARLEDIL